MSITQSPEIFLLEEAQLLVLVLQEIVFILKLGQLLLELFNLFISYGFRSCLWSLSILQAHLIRSL